MNFSMCPQHCLRAAKPVSQRDQLETSNPDRALQVANGRDHDMYKVFRKHRVGTQLCPMKLRAISGNPGLMTYLS